MILKRISILNYKNLEQADLTFSPKLNCLVGQNGMGKTNLLDAIYYLSFCKSAGNPIDSQNMLHTADFFVIQGFYEDSDGTREEIYCGMKRRQKKQFKRNKKEYTRLSETHVSACWRNELTRRERGGQLPPNRFAAPLARTTERRGFSITSSHRQKRHPHGCRP